MLQRKARHLTAWLALVVMLLGALAPAISRALAASQVTTFGGDICTSQGPRWLTLAQAQGATPAAVPPNIPGMDDAHHGPASISALDHCPFCLLVADRWGPPTASSVHFFHAESGLVPPDAQVFFFATFLHFPALPRGPPVLV